MAYHFSSPADVLSDPGLDWAVTEALDRGDDAETVAARFGMTVYAVRATCGERGHDYETMDSGDATTPYYAVWRCCITCGAPDEREGDFD